MSDLGNLNDALRLHCKACGERWPDDTVMEAVQLHCQVEHETDRVELDLKPVCSCGATMEHTVTRPTGGGFKDYFKCGACGNTGFVGRTGKDPRPRRG